MEALQIYWWLVISLLGGLLVFLLFVQGGQTMIWSERNHERKTLMVNALGRKWELTFTTLVVFGGAFFASFPPLLFNKFRRSLLAVDADSPEFHPPGCQLRIPLKTG